MADSSLAGLKGEHIN